MAEEEAAGHGIGATFTKKVGPLPLIVWVLLLGGAYLYLKKKGSTSSSSAPIDSVTGYPTGSAQDQSALAAENAAGSGGSAGSTTSGSTTAGQYADNNAWSRAAINFLVGVGIDPVEANSAITQYVSSQTLTTQQQADVNLAIQGIGGPPDPPTPGNAPPPVVTPPSPGPVYATNPPSGLAVSGKTSSTLSVKWNASSNATGYTVTYWSGNQAPQTATASGTGTSTTLSGLSPNSLYTIQVQATPAKPSDPFASTTASTTTAAGAPSGGGGSAPAQKTHTVTVVKFAGNPPPWNSTLSGIASHEHTTVPAILALNPSIKNANLIFPGQSIKVPG
jgi:LysM repeat protein